MAALLTNPRIPNSKGGSMIIEPTPETLDHILASINEGIRVKKLSNAELFREVMNCEKIGDDLRVLELMNRINPDWLDEV